MGRPLHRLSISSQEPGAVFRVTDGNSARVGIGMYRLELELPRGLYTVSAMLGASIDAKEVILDRDQSVEFGRARPSFGDHAGAVAGRVLAALPAGALEGPGTAVIALRGPYRVAGDAAGVIELDLDGSTIEPAASGTVQDEAGAAWGWQAFRIGEEAPGAPGIATATRLVEGVRTGHVVPRMGGRVVWACYPAPQACAPDGAALPLAHYVRLRLARPGTVPDPGLQGLSDQVFTALAGRSTVPLSAPVLDLLLADDADPLLALASAHVASLMLAQDGLLPALPQDSRRSDAAAKEQAQAPSPGPYQRSIDPELLRQRIVSWLEQDRPAPVASCPDMVAVRALFGLPVRADIRRPPVLLRSLDAMIEATDPESARGAALLTVEDGVWRTRFQVSESFAYLQWEPDRDGEQLLMQQVRQSFELARTFDEARQSLEPEPVAAALDRPRAAVMGFGMRAPVPVDPMEAFMEKRAASFRIPASAVREMASQLAKSRSQDP